MARKDSTALSRTTVSSTVASDSRGGCGENTKSLDIPSPPSPGLEPHPAHPRGLTSSNKPSPLPFIKIAFKNGCSEGFKGKRSSPEEANWFGVTCSVSYELTPTLHVAFSQTHLHSSVTSCVTVDGGFTMLVRLVLNSRPQVICPPWPPKCLDDRLSLLPQSPKQLELQAYTTTPGLLNFVGMRPHYVVQAGLKLLSSSDPLTLPSQNASITGMSHCNRL
ncbi:hypothetical protein AAY473_019697 [Plecturocebus cupreus]